MITAEARMQGHCGWEGEGVAGGGFHPPAVQRQEPGLAGRGGVWA